MTSRQPAGPAWRCDRCQKVVFTTKRVARQFARRAHPGEATSAYESCNGDGWHIGHKPAWLEALREARR
jgi:hypothetical protein